MYSICRHEPRTNYEFENSTACRHEPRTKMNSRIAQRLQTYEPGANDEFKQMTEHNCSLSSLVFRSIREGMQAVFLNWECVIFLSSLVKISASVQHIIIHGCSGWTTTKMCHQAEKTQEKQQSNNEIETVITHQKNIREKSSIIYVGFAVFGSFV